MSRQRRTWSAIAMTALVSTGCGASAIEAAAVAQPKAAMSAPSREAAPGSIASPATPDARVEPSMAARDEPHAGDLLVYTAHLTMAVYRIGGALASVEQIARDVGGYLSTRDDTRITIRVPRARFGEALAKIEPLGDVTHRDVSAEDVTEEFADLEIRIKNARAIRDRLQMLLDRAQVKEALEVERELGRVTEEIERMEGRLKLLGSKVAYSTIEVAFSERAIATPTSRPTLPFPWLRELGLSGLLELGETK